MTDNANNPGNQADDMSEYLQTFLDETEEQLDDLVETMLALENDSTNPDELNEAFRLVHSIKGSAGIMGFESITVLTHQLENRFERFRSGMDTLDGRTMSLVLRCIDFLRQCNGRMRNAEPLGAPTDLLNELRRLEEEAANHDEANESVQEIGSTADKLPQSVVDEKSLAGQAVRDSSERTHEDESHQMVVRFRAGLQLIDLKARLIVNRLSGLGNVLRTWPDLENEGEFENLIEFEIFIESDADLDCLQDSVNVEGVESVEFVGHQEQVKVNESAAENLDAEKANANALGYEEAASVPSADPSDSQLEVIDSKPPERKRAVDLNEAEALHVDESQAREIEPAVQPVAVIAGESVPHEKPTPTSSAKIAKVIGKVAETMRVDINRLDNLMNLTGELVVNRARFEQISEQISPALKKATMRNRVREFSENLRRIIETLEKRAAADGGDLSAQLQQLRDGMELMDEQSAIWENGRQCIGQIGEAIDQLSGVSDSLQRSVLDTRMVSVGPLFSRFKRVVRDLAKERDKEVNLVVRGEKTEMDKRLIDELGDPLVHLVRNSIDHGLETQDQRIVAGKTKAGTICLEASHSGNNVYIQVSDDGGGIDVERIKSKLVGNGILSETAAAELSREQTLDFIWNPGFSTASEITDVSGRGVGMDVVKTRIRKLNGTVEVESTPGQGTRFTIRLPLTLAIINCLMVRMHDVIFSIPINDVREIVSVAQDSVLLVLGKKTFEIRDQYLPLVNIEDVFRWHDLSDRKGMSWRNEGNRPQTVNLQNGENQIVVLRAAGKTIGLHVDEFLGSQDIVVKSLSDNFVGIRGLSGASILGDGSVSLMLDVGTFINMANNASVMADTGEPER